MPLVPGTQLGRYEIRSLLGAGGMGEVYQAYDTTLDRVVAIKVLPSDFTQDEDRLRRFVREARAASALNHPNIVTIHEISQSEVGRFIVMEWIEGRTLRALIAQPPSPATCAELGTQIAKALRVAHATGIVHRDIKPENLMVRDDGYVKVLDFGIARLIHKRSSEPEAVTEITTDPQTLDTTHEVVLATSPGALLGTLRYMSPEQARGETVDSATDIFSLGIVFYELMTGQHPYIADSPMGTRQAILTQSPLPPSSLNPQITATLETLILQMLEKDSRLRPTAADVGAVLAEFTGKISVYENRVSPARVKRHTVGRETERAELRGDFASVARGEGGMLFCLSGEPGIGKTTLVEDFLADLSASGENCQVARGRCSERLAGTEAYLPFLEALDSLLHSDEGTSAAAMMKLVAPTWYVHMTPLSETGSSTERLLADIKTASQERMKREISTLLQKITALRPLVLFIDDMHWADASTVDLLAYLATKFEGLRLLVIASYRQSDLLLSKHPFLQVKQDLQSRGLCREMLLQFLTHEDVERYLALEFPEHRFPAEFSALIHAKTEGSPLFMVDLMRYLRDRKVISQEQGRWSLVRSMPAIERELPESVRGMIQRKIDQLGREDLQLLTAASAQGYKFDSAVVAQALAIDPAEVEERLDALDRVHAFVHLVEEKEFPDRTLTLHYRFVHVLYQNMLFSSLMPTRRASLSRAVAEALSSHYGKRRLEIASELAFLFEAARDFSRAADYFLIASQQAAKVYAYQETVALARRGLEMLKALADSPEWMEKELMLQITLGTALMYTRGYASPEVGAVYNRARELCQQIGDTPQLSPVLLGLWAFYYIRAEFGTALEVANQVMRLAESAKEVPLLLWAHQGLGLPLWHCGEFLKARSHLEQAISLYEPHQNEVPFQQPQLSTDVISLCYASQALWVLGYTDQALQRVQEALSLGQRLHDPPSMAAAPHFAAWHHNLRQEAAETQQHAEDCIRLSSEHGFPFWLASATVLGGWALAEQGQVKEGIEQMRQGLNAYKSTGARLVLPLHLMLLAETLGKQGQVEEGLGLLDEAFSAVNDSGERWCEAELYRIKGDLLLMPPSNGQGSLNTRSDHRDTTVSEQPNSIGAEACYRQAISIARGQQAKSLELRVTIRLSHLYLKQGKREEAREMISEVYGWFTEGFDSVDLREARRLIEELSQSYI